ncbi:MAG: DUF4445 domain-containing protein [Deltaproteobacteria bacterium]|nr:DUF4445 domain-containing protein [Deltaproteobacteria bacterium]
MGKCINHPDRETPYICLKHNIYLCEECLKCQDVDLYCKFRPSCPIYFIAEKGFDAPKEKQAPQEEYLITFEPEGKEISVTRGTNLMEAAHKADVYINASCNGKGACGKCKLIIESGEVESLPTSLLSENEKEKGYVLACQSSVKENIVARIPEETIEKKLKSAGMGDAATKKLAGLVDTIEPIVGKIPLQLNKPTMDDTVSDLDRLKRSLKESGCNISTMSTNIRVMRQLTESVRDDHWKVMTSVLWKKCSSEIVNVTPFHAAKPSLGMAIDLGTTSIVVYIVNMEDGKILSAASGHNGQASCGDDVINRIVCSEKDGVKKLKRLAVATINNLSQRALESIDADYHQVENLVISGNTTMTHLLLGIEAKYIRREPYIPTVSEFPIIKAGEIGLKAAYYGGVFVMPGPASYVGGDIVSGVLYTGFHKLDQTTLFIDIGTNGEIVLGNNEFLITAACSAGPAFEGGGIRCGMRAEEGAIEKITLDPDTFEPHYETVEEYKARGICGSGMIDLLSEMLLKGVISQDGKFAIETDHPRLTIFNEEPAFILAATEDTDTEEDIVFTQSDIRSLILSKAAVYAGFTILLEQVGMDFSSISQMIITGGFGQYLNIEKAITIGMLPDIEREKFNYMGNSSVAGAYMALLSKEYRQEAVTISNTMTYLDFSSNNAFMDAFVRAQFLPHTDEDLFPSVHADNKLR